MQPINLQENKITPQNKNPRKEMNNKIILVKYCGGDYEDYYTSVVFATANKKTAKNYVTKFNRILKKWKDYYSQFEQDENGFGWLKSEYAKSHFNRWYSLRNIDKCYYEEIEIRNQQPIKNN